MNTVVRCCVVGFFLAFQAFWIAPALAGKVAVSVGKVQGLHDLAWTARFPGESLTIGMTPFYTQEPQRRIVAIDATGKQVSEALLADPAPFLNGPGPNYNFHDKAVVTWSRGGIKWIDLKGKERGRELLSQVQWVRKIGTDRLAVVIKKTSYEAEVRIYELDTKLNAKCIEVQTLTGDMTMEWLVEKRFQFDPESVIALRGIEEMSLWRLRAKGLPALVRVTTIPRLYAEGSMGPPVLLGQSWFFQNTSDSETFVSAYNLSGEKSGSLKISNTDGVLPVSENRVLNVLSAEDGGSAKMRVQDLSGKVLVEGSLKCDYGSLYGVSRLTGLSLWAFFGYAKGQTIFYLFDDSGLQAMEHTLASGSEVRFLSADSYMVYTNGKDEAEIFRVTDQ